jgi:hypothetical protein
MSIPAKILRLFHVWPPLWPGLAATARPLGGGTAHPAAREMSEFLKAFTLPVEQALDDAREDRR